MVLTFQHQTSKKCNLLETAHSEEISKVSIKVSSVDDSLHQLIGLADELLLVSGVEFEKTTNIALHLWKRNWSKSSLSFCTSPSTCNIDVVTPLLFTASIWQQNKRLKIMQNYHKFTVLV